MEYQFKTRGDTIFATCTALGSAVALGAGISLFSPAVVTAAGTYAAWRVARYMNGERYKNAVQGLSKYPKMPQDSRIGKIAAEFSAQLGIKVPDIYIVPDWGNAARPDLKYAACPAAHALIVSESAASRLPPESVLRYVISHEMSHLKTDKYSIAKYACDLVPLISKPFCIIGLAMLALAGVAMVGGFAIPAVLSVSSIGTGVGALMGFGLLHYTAQAIAATASRREEVRADRNGLYINRDLEAARKFMAYFRPRSQTPFDLHPGHFRRLEAMAKSFNFVSKYPLPKPAAISASVLSARPAF